MQFVDDVLESLFQKSPAEAYRIMMQVHLNGRGVAGIYPWEVAETKVDTLISRARAAGHPLQAAIEDA
jgi:ATP-dependent Clp protease adaptor protein ClpS